MPVYSLLFVVSIEMKIFFDKILTKVVKVKFSAEWWHDKDIHTFKLHHMISCGIQMKMSLDKILIM
jgi:hypothetical protein